MGFRRAGASSQPPPPPERELTVGNEGRPGPTHRQTRVRARPAIAAWLRPTRPSMPPPHSRTPRLRPRSLHAPPRGRIRQPPGDKAASRFQAKHPSAILRSSLSRRPPPLSEWAAPRRFGKAVPAGPPPAGEAQSLSQDGRRPTGCLNVSRGPLNAPSAPGAPTCRPRLAASIV